MAGEESRGRPNKKECHAKSTIFRKIKNPPTKIKLTMPNLVQLRSFIRIWRKSMKIWDPTLFNACPLTYISL